MAKWHVFDMLHILILSEEKKINFDDKKFTYTLKIFKDKNVEENLLLDYDY